MSVPDPPPPPPLTRGELRLCETAFNREWPIPQSVRTQLLQRLISILEAEDEDDLPAGMVPLPETGRARDRLAIAAFRAISAAAGHNLRREAIEIQARKLDLLIERERLRALAAEDDQADGGIDPAAAERALKALNEPPEP